MKPKNVLWVLILVTSIWASYLWGWNKGFAVGKFIPRAIEQAIQMIEENFTMSFTWTADNEKERYFILTRLTKKMYKENVEGKSISIETNK